MQFTPIFNLFFKSGNGSGNFGHRGRPGKRGGSQSLSDHPKLSNQIKTLSEAKGYFISKIAGTHSLIVHRKSGEFPVKVTIDARNTHPYTRKAESGETPEVMPDRMFDLRRAQLLDQIIATITKPAHLLWHAGSDLYFSHRISENEYYLVVVRVKKTYEGEVSSAYPVDSAYLRKKQRELRSTLPVGHKGKGRKLKKSLRPLGSLNSQALEEVPGNSVRLKTLSGLPASTHRYQPGHNHSIGHSVLFFKSIPPGARWITVHPNGKDTKGQPLLVQPEKNGTMRVIGGAGGKLNYLKLKGVRSEAEYKSEAAERAKSKREDKKLKTKRDKDNGLHESKQEARRNVKSQKTEHEQKFIESVSEAMGWKDESIRFQEDDYKNISEKALDLARGKHHRATLKKANEAVDSQRKQIVADSAGRLKDIGEIPLDSDDPNLISVQDLDPVRKTTGLGYSANYRERAGGKGLTDDDLEAEKEGFQSSDEKERDLSAESIRDELKGLREPGSRDADIQLLSTRKSIELLKAQKSLKAVQAQAKKAGKDIDQSVEPKAYVLAVDRVTDKDVLSDLQNDLKTVSTRAFLEEIGKTDDYESQLGRHIGVGTYNSVNALSLAATGTAIVGRDAVDVLGISGTAQILARRLNSDMTSGEVADILQSIESFHVDHYLKASEESLQEARQWQDVAKNIEIDSAVDGHDLAHMQELNAKRRDAVNHAERILGTTLGEMEANAALVMALQQKPKDSIQVSLGKVSVENAIIRARAIGLERGDYQIERIGANTFMTVQGAGMDRLAKPVSKDGLQQVRRNMDIIEGRQDEDNWLPLGIANRPDLVTDVPAGVAPRLAEAFTAGDDLEQSVRDYIGGRTADGDPPADILADLQSLDSLDKVGDRRDEYFKTLDQLAPNKDSNGDMIRVESHQKAFEEMADKFVSDRHGKDRQPLHKQSIETNQFSVDALHRALAETPTGILAYKPVGDLDRKEQGHLRNWFYKNVASKDESVGELREQLDILASSEPEKEAEDMFGVSTNPAWIDWKQRRDDLAEEINSKDLSWSRYSKIMGGPVDAYASIQDQVRSNIAAKFHEIHNKTNPDKPLKLGRTVIAGNLNHLDAVDPNARDQRLADQRELVDSLRERVNGQYASGGVSGKIESARESMAAAAQSQMGLFSADEIKDDEPEKSLKADERYTLGHAAERQIAAMMPMVGKNFRPGKPANLWQASMNGKYINAQRAIKLIDQNKRVVLAQGVGSGKSIMMLGGFTNLQQQGKVKKGIFIVPSIVQGQFSGESLRYLESGKFNWHIEPGASRESRIASYKNPKNHFSVVTHQGFRDDMLHLGAKHAGISEKQLSDQLAGQSTNERKHWMRGVIDKEGINWDYLAVDEGHDLLNRAGKDNSILANVVDSLSANSPYYVNASADPVKNDPSEIFDLLHKMEPSRYTDQKQFMRRYGVDTAASKDELRRELARYFYPGHIKSGVKANKKEITVPLSDEQKSDMKDVQKNLARARLARIKGDVDIDAMKTLSPHLFEGVDESQHKAIAGKLQQSLGILKHSSIQRVIDNHPKAAKLDEVSRIAGDKKGRPGVIFTRSLANVKRLAERLKKEGHRVVTITGKDSAKAKEENRLKFRPEQGEAEADILICSDAGAVGLNAQRGQWLVQYDTPVTAKVHAQRAGRIDRLGQKNEVDLIDLVADHPSERKNRKRLAKKYDLREIMTTPLEGLDDTGIAGYLNRARMEREQKSLL